MTANVETMAYTNEVPWHGLGEYIKDVPTVDDMLKQAGLDWKVTREPMKLHDGSAVPDFAALQRSSDKKILDVVGSRYQPAQNKQVFGFFKEFVEQGKATMETAGSLAGGRYVWGLANLKQSFKLSSSDIINGYLLAAIPHQQGKSLILKFTNVRVVCQNTIALALKEKGTEFRMNHRNQFDKEMMEHAKEVLGIAREQMGEFEANAKKLVKLKLSEKDAIKILADLYQPTAEIKVLVDDFGEEANKKMTMLLDIYHKAPGATPGSGWGVLNAVTYYADHMASRTPDKRLTNAWLGKTANQKEAVLDTLLKMAS